MTNTKVCPGIEQLDAYSADPQHSDPAVREHVAACEECRAQIAELTENQSFIAELGNSAAGLGVRLAGVAAKPPQIAGFDVLREVGRGGMGVVYEARQRQPERRVAIKVLRADYVRDDERMRLFNREIRVLARLRHVGITAIYECGAANEGPYYAMEFVEGVTLSEYTRQRAGDSEHQSRARKEAVPRDAPVGVRATSQERADSLRDRLQLFLRLCAAVTHAHQHGVIHRDLKPGNIIVEAGGALKVLDFGLARITDADVTQATATMDSGRIAGTLAYMSPEQARGAVEDVDVRSDVYSLGVILFELLTGTLPYEVSRTSAPAAMRAVCESPARRLSDVVAGHRDGKALRGDLDTIVLKCLEKSPAERYQSVAALADDIERYLSNQPILARPPSAWYQFRKFARRNRVLVGGVAAVFAALALGIVATTWQGWRAREAERAARDEVAVNAEINRFLTTMFGSVSPQADGHDVRVVQILKRASDDLKRSFADQPRVKLALHDAVGRAYQSLTLYADAEPHFLAGLKLAREQFGGESRQALQFQYNLAEAAVQLGRIDEGRAALNETLEMQRRRLGPDDPDTLTTLNMLGVLHVETGEAEEGERVLREALAGRLRALGAENEKTLDSMANVGILALRRGERDEGAKLLRDAHETALRVFGPDRAQTLVLASHVATLARTPEEFEAIEPMYRDLVERGSRVFGPTHQQTLAFLESLAQLLEIRNKYGEAAEVAREAYERLRSARGERDARTLAALGAYARITGMTRDYVAAEALLRELLALRADVDGPAGVPTLDVEYDLAHMLNSAGRLEEALALATESLRKRTEVQGQSGGDTALARTLRAEILRKLGRLDEARAAAEQALADQKAAAAHEALIGWTESVLGATLRDQKRFAEAEPLLLHAHESLVRGVGGGHPTTAEARMLVIELYEQWHAQEPQAGYNERGAAFRRSNPS